MFGCWIFLAIHLLAFQVTRDFFTLYSAGQLRLWGNPSAKLHICIIYGWRSCRRSQNPESNSPLGVLGTESTDKRPPEKNVPRKVGRGVLGIILPDFLKSFLASESQSFKSQRSTFSEFQSLRVSQFQSFKISNSKVQDVWDTYFQQIKSQSITFQIQCVLN